MARNVPVTGTAIGTVSLKQLELLKEQLTEIYHRNSMIEQSSLEDVRPVNANREIGVYIDGFPLVEPKQFCCSQTTTNGYRNFDRFRYEEA